MKYWHEYIKASYDLVLEAEGIAKTYLDDAIESYVVHLLARNFTRTDIGAIPIALQMLEAYNQKNYKPIADECLLINSWPIKRSRWPTDSYYFEMGVMAYSMANLEHMSKNFAPASKILKSVFNRAKNDN